MVSARRVALALSLTAGAGLATTVGALAAFWIPAHYTKVLPFSLAFSAGVMIYLSFVEILHHSLHSFEEDSGDLLAHTYTSLSFFAGILVGYLIDKCVHLMGYHHVDISVKEIQAAQNEATDHVANVAVREESDEFQSANPTSGNAYYKSLDTSAKSELAKEAGTEAETEKGPLEVQDFDSETASAHDDRHLMKVSLVTALAIALHNFPEGLVTFAATISDPELGASVAVAIAIHNIPEGISVAVPVYFATRSRKQAFMWAFLSGVAEPIGGLLGWALVDSMFGDAAFGVMFGIAAGIMIFISFKELLPTARKKDADDKYCTALVFAGFVVMDFSLLLFEI